MKGKLWRRTWFQRLRGLQARMTLSYIVVTLAAVLLLEVSHPSMPLTHGRLLPWNPMILFDVVLVPLLGGVFGIISTWGLVGRLRRMAEATTHFARGQYASRLPVTVRDEIGQLEAHLNQMAEQLAEHLAREKILAEQNARLEERAHLSRDLHDSVKQQVFALAVQVELARSLLDLDAARARTHLGFADDLSYQVQQELTTLIHALRPADVQAKGLTAAVQDYVARWSAQNGIRMTLWLPPTCLLPSPVEDALWRVIQEALSNVARHSQASQVCLRLEGTSHQITLLLSDNGQGFDPQAAALRGLGLRSIRERIEQMGGTVRISSRSGAGTQIAVQCFLPPGSEHPAVTPEVSA
jgi:NarL family two-component system sensor histidine kinase LiaS